MIPMIFWMMKQGQRWRNEAAAKKERDAEK
jgi:hypothetical protein